MRREERRGKRGDEERKTGVDTPFALLTALYSLLSLLP
jgi:hypothetical protein